MKDIIKKLDKHINLILYIVEFLLSILFTKSVLEFLTTKAYYRISFSW